MKVLINNNSLFDFENWMESRQIIYNKEFNSYFRYNYELYKGLNEIYEDYLRSIDFDNLIK